VELSISLYSFGHTIDVDQDIAYIPVCDQMVLWNGGHLVLFQLIVVIACLVTNNQLT
jgi:hypothetical protein